MRRPEMPRMSEPGVENASKPPSIRRTEARLAVGATRSLFRRSWLPLRPERVIVLVHGFGEHSGRYEEFGTWFAGHGCAVHSFDQTGHGRSGGKRGHVRRFNEFLDDLDVFLELARSEHPSLPCALVGHSMGGLIAAAFARERAPEVDCLVTSGPLLVLGSGSGGAKLLLARVFNRIWPTFTSDAGITPELLSRDPEVGRRYLADPLVHSSMTAGLGVSLTDGVGRTAAGGAAIRVPCLMLHGAADRLCAPAGSEAFFAGVTTPKSALKIYPELRHEIFNEPEREEVFRDILGWWVDGRIPADSVEVAGS
jgi:alpha-beta hydrolase superfamily lysophospholipase